MLSYPSIKRQKEDAVDRTITPESLIETRGLSRAAILATLYNAASKVGHGTKNPGPDTMTEEDAKACMASSPCYAFDYLNGKRLKIDLTDSAVGIVAGQYDYGQGHGTAKRAIEILRSTGDPSHPDIAALQVVSKAAAEVASAPLRKSGTITYGPLEKALGVPSPVDCPDAPCITINL